MKTKNLSFCFYCLLFGGNDARSTLGCIDFKHVSDKIKKHEKSIKHIENAVSYNMLGSVNIMSELNSGHNISIKRHNETVKRNRHILNRVIDCIKFCGVHELALRGHDESD